MEAQRPGSDQRPDGKIGGEDPAPVLLGLREGTSSGAIRIEALFGQPSFPHTSFAGFLEKEKPPAGPDVGSRFDSVPALSRGRLFIRSEPVGGNGEMAPREESAQGGVQPPVLEDSIRECKANGHVLLVAKLDRLSRNLHFITALQNSKVELLVADNPHANAFLIHILVAVAEHERNMISSRTKAALEAARRRGVWFGNPRYEEAVPKATKAWVRLSTDRNAELRRIVKETMDVTRVTKLTEIAHALNLRGVKTNRGCQFSAVQVHRLLKTAQTP